MSKIQYLLFIFILTSLVFIPNSLLPQVGIIQTSSPIDADSRFLGGGNIDSDPQDELIYSHSDGVVYVIDGNSAQIEWESTGLSYIRISDSPFFNYDQSGLKAITFKARDTYGESRIYIVVNSTSIFSDPVHGDSEFKGGANIDNDQQDELVYSHSDGGVYILDGNSALIEWESTGLSNIRITDNPFYLYNSNGMKAVTFKANDATGTSHIYLIGSSTSGLVQPQDQPTFPKKVILNQNYPNPFNPNTTISYYLPKSGFVEIEIYDQLGQKVKTLISKQQNPGNYNVNWDGTNKKGINLATGIYYYQLNFDGQLITKSMMILK